MVHAIPVVRAADLAKRGTGRIKFTPSNAESGELLGHGSLMADFSRDLSVGATIAVLQGNGSQYCIPRQHVIGVVCAPENSEEWNTNTCRLHRAIESSDFFSKANGIGTYDTFFDFVVIPRIDHARLYDTVYDQLDGGGAVGIFPEGGSHDRPAMLPFKAGIATMALGAIERNPTLAARLKIVPVGISYFHPDRFRSKAYVEFGEPFSPTPRQIAQFVEGGGGRASAVASLLHDVRVAVEALTINAPSLECLQFVHLARKLYRPHATPIRSSFGSVEVARRILRLTTTGSTAKDPFFCDFYARCIAYLDTLKLYGLMDYHVVSLLEQRSRGLRREHLDVLNIKKFALLALLLVRLLAVGLLAFPGLLLNVPALAFIAHFSRNKAAEALRASSVKVAARDVVASWKLVAAVVAIPALFSLYAAAFCVWMVVWRARTLTLPSGALWAGSVMLLNGLVSYFSIFLWQKNFAYYARIKILLFFICRRRPLFSVVEQRAELERLCIEFFERYRLIRGNLDESSLVNGCLLAHDWRKTDTAAFSEGGSGSGGTLSTGAASAASTDEEPDEETADDIFFF